MFEMGRGVTYCAMGAERDQSGGDKMIGKIYAVIGEKVELEGSALAFSTVKIHDQ